MPGWPGEKAGRAGDRTEVEEEEVVRRRFSFSLSPEEELLPMLARDTRPFLLLEGVPGVAGVLPPLDGVRLVVPGVPGVGGGARPCALPARGRPGVLVVRLGVPLGVRGVPAADVRPTRGPEDRRPGRPF